MSGYCCSQVRAFHFASYQRVTILSHSLTSFFCEGTPMKNGKPSNLFPLLKAVGHPFGKHQRAYEACFCAGRQKQFGRGPPVWDASGASNLDQLRELVSSHLLHLTKEECLKALPKATRQHRWIPVSHRQQMQYNQSLSELVRCWWRRSQANTDYTLNLFLSTAKALCHGI